MQIYSGYRNGKNQTNINKLQMNINFNRSMNFDEVCFKGIKKPSRTKVRAVALTIMTLTAGLKPTNMFAEVRKASENLVENVSTLTKRILYSFNELLPKTEKLSKDCPPKSSYYYDLKVDGNNPIPDEIYKKKFNDYKRLIENVPEEFKNKGDDTVAIYQNSIFSILETCSEYGAMYIKNIPDIQNIAAHADGLKRLSQASKKIQGCALKNAAIFNGFTSDELMRKVVIPNEKLANGEIVGKNENNLIFIAHEFGTDKGNAYKDELSSNVLNSRHLQIADKKYDFDASFLEHYDNIFVIQPNAITADEALNNSFGTIEKGLYPGANMDIIYSAHGADKNLSPRLCYLSQTSSPNAKSQLNLGDFDPINQGGQSYAQNLKHLLERAISNGFNPRFVGNGCFSDFIEEAMSKILSKEYQGKVHVFGTPYSINGVPALGFNKGKLSYITKVDMFDGNYGMIIRLTETDPGTEILNRINEDSFFITRDSLGNKIMANGKSPHQIVNVLKPNGMLMECDVREMTPIN